MDGTWFAFVFACVSPWSCTETRDTSQSAPHASGNAAAVTYQQHAEDLSAPARYVRGSDPWVLRSVVDGHPRMLSAALRPHRWVAYDVQGLRLYKVWAGELNLDGAVYNTHHGPQPTAQGTTLLENTFDAPSPWHVLRGGRDQPVTPRYRGHRFVAQQLYLDYTLQLEDGTNILVSERPELVGGDDSPVLERTFAVQQLPADTRVELDFHADALTTEAHTRVTDRTRGVTGRLLFERSEETRLGIVLQLPPPAAEHSAQAASAATPAELMAASDCAACHNPTHQTVGPSYLEIAQRYRTNQRTIRGLARKIREGGSFQWGEAAMVAHPYMSAETALRISEYILTTYDPGDARGRESTHPLSAEALTDDNELSSLVPGVTWETFQLGQRVSGLPTIAADEVPSARVVTPYAVLGSQLAAVPGEGVLVRVHGWLKLDVAGEYDFRIQHDGAVQFSVRGWRLIHDGDAEGLRDSAWASMTLEAGLHPFELLYRPGYTDERHMQLDWQPPDSDAPPLPVPSSALATSLKGLLPVSAGVKAYRRPTQVPGDRSPLLRMHPSFDLHAARPHRFRPRVGGLDFLADGRPVLSTWDAEGAVYVLEDAANPDPEAIRVRQIARGLSEPLGLKVVEGGVYVLQKHELTKLVDADGDGTTDAYVSVASSWGATPNFHEFAFGLAYRDNAFYATLATAVEPGGAAVKVQNKDRGTILRIAADSGDVEFLAHGLRTPNGIGTGSDGELFVTDNEGDWLPASKLVHVVPGAFYGAHLIDPQRTRKLPVTEPVAWLPQDEISFSPSQPMQFSVGPYQNQILYGDVTFGGLNRVVTQRVGSTYQGCVLPFAQGLEAGVNRIATAPDGSIYVGGIGNPADWSQEHKLWYGLQRISYNGATAFELLDVQARADGLLLTFTEPVQAGDGERAQDYAITQWHYVPTAAYGGNKMQERRLAVQSVHMAPDRRHVFVAITGIEPKHVVHVRLAEPMLSEAAHELWATEAWCTINALPQEHGERFGTAGMTKANALTRDEQARGYVLLFDGTPGAHLIGGSVYGDRIAPGPKPGDSISTREPYADFELSFDWRVTKPGAGALYLRVADPIHPPTSDAIEVTLADGQSTDPTRCQGGISDLYPTPYVLERAVGELNRSRIVVRGSTVQHWLNGRSAFSFDTRSADFRARAQSSCLRESTDLGHSQGGALVFVERGGGLELRNLRVRPL